MQLNHPTCPNTSNPHLKTVKPVIAEALLQQQLEKGEVKAISRTNVHAVVDSYLSRDGEPDLQSYLGNLEKLLSDREAVVRAWKNEKGGKALGSLCSYVPQELIWAFEILPVRIHGLTGYAGANLADTQLPAFVCPFIRTALDQGLKGLYSELDGLLFTYTCDAACGLFNIWKQALPGGIFHSLPHAYDDSPEAAQFSRAALRECLTVLEGFTGRPLQAEMLRRSLRLYSRIAELVAMLYRHRRLRRPGLEGKIFYMLLYAGFFLPPDLFLSILERVIALLPAPGERQGAPLLLLGTNLSDLSLVEQVEAAGGVVVDDDLCSGRRFFLRGGIAAEQPPGGTRMEEPPADCGDLLDAICQLYRRRLPCPTRVSARERLAHILTLYRESGAQGIILAVPKFCDPLLADYPFLQQSLRREQIPLLMLEMEERAGSAGQWKTRIEGLLEVMAGI